MIACTIIQLEQRAKQRGYTLAEVRECVVRESGDAVIVDETHERYPRESRYGPNRPTAADAPGDELKQMLSAIGMYDYDGCQCSSRAAMMNFWGADGCEKRISTIVGWLREEAKNRGLPFFAPVARLLVKRAIARARKTTLK